MSTRRRPAVPAHGPAVRQRSSRKRFPKQPRVVSATEAAKRLGALVDRVRDERAAYIIERGGTAVARLEPIETARCTLRDLAALLSDLDAPDAAYLDEVERAVAEFNRPALPASPWES